VCPQRIIIASGYSQGAAVITTAIAKLPIEIKSRIAGVALWGSTLNKQNKGLIPDFPADRAKTWCNKSDGVCGGQLLINAGHLAYTQSQFKEATTWLAGNVQKLKEISESA
jgi:cutinase